MNHTIKGFFFDLDGTLVDTHEANYHAYREAIKDVRDVEPGEELKQRIVKGESSKQFLPGIIEDLSDEEVAQINDKKKEIYPNYLHHSTLNEYLSNFLSQLSEHYQTVLVTTAKRDNALAVIRHHGIEGLFSDMIFGEDVSQMKPAPDAYLLALEKTGLSADEVIVFEDSASGLKAAEAAGIKAIHIRSFEK